MPPKKINFIDKKNKEVKVVKEVKEVKDVKDVQVNSDEIEKPSVKPIMKSSMKPKKSIINESVQIIEPIIKEKSKPISKSLIVEDIEEAVADEEKIEADEVDEVDEVELEEVDLNKKGSDKPKLNPKKETESQDATQDAIHSDTPKISQKSSTSKSQAKSTHNHSKPKKIVASKQTESSFDMFGDDDVDFRYIMMNYDYTKNKTLPKITKYERALLIGKRAKQIEEGANPNIKVKDGQSAIEIAEEELRQRKIPLIIKRPNGNTFEYWKPADMEVLMD